MNQGLAVAPADVDIAVVGAGAAGMMAGVFAGRTLRAAGVERSIAAIDGVKKLGAKILVAGGGRCNVTHDVVDELSYAGSTRPAIRKVLGRFGIGATVEFFREFGVELKREETGKLFPVTDDAHTILNALLRAAQEAGVKLVHPWRVDSIRLDRETSTLRPFVIRGASGDEIRAARVVLATGGMALPKSGSDGHGLQIARSLGHSVTPRVFPALVPLVVDAGRSFIPTLSGLTVRASVRVHAGTGKRIAEFSDSMLCTHFGLSGPAVLDASRYFLDARAVDPAASLRINWLVRSEHSATPDEVDRVLTTLGTRSVLRYLVEFLPDRLARAICESVGVDPTTPGHALTRDRRRMLVAALTDMPIPVSADRGFTFAEVTAGGVPLSEVRLETMESRLCPGLHLCGEICDVDGRIGGYNFQWAWASGYTAGVGAANAVVAAAGVKADGA